MSYDEIQEKVWLKPLYHLSWLGQDPSSSIIVLNSHWKSSILSKAPSIVYDPDRLFVCSKSRIKEKEQWTIVLQKLSPYHLEKSYGQPQKSNKIGTIFKKNVELKSRN